MYLVEYENECLMLVQYLFYLILCTYFCCSTVTVGLARRSSGWLFRVCDGSRQLLLRSRRRELRRSQMLRRNVFVYSGFMRLCFKSGVYCIGSTGVQDTAAQIGHVIYILLTCTFKLRCPVDSQALLFLFRDIVQRFYILIIYCVYCGSVDVRI